METFVVIPACNEEKHIQKVIAAAKQYTSQVVFVDDGSKDQTAAIAEQQEVVVLKHFINMGKGAALKTGCDYAYSHGAKNIIVIDGDGQHNPHKIPQFLHAVEEVDIVFGYRELGQSMPFILRFGNWFINKSTQWLYHIKLRDTQCGYRAFTAGVYPKIRWQAADYSMESEMIAQAGKHKLKYREIPIETIYSDKYKGTTVLDGIKIVAKMVKWRLS